MKGEEQREHPRLRLELPVRAQIQGGGYRDFQIVDISAEGLQLWCHSIEPLRTAMEGDDVITFEIRFDAKVAWTQELEDRSALTGWRILLDD